MDARTPLLTRRARRVALACGALLLGGAHALAEPTRAPALSGEGLLLIGLGDSLTHGTMDGTLNATNTLNAYLQRVAEQRAQVQPLRFAQPLFDEAQQRLHPARPPTNLGVNGADLFSAAGLQYYKRVGADQSVVDASFFSDARWPWMLEGTYEKVLYPLNLAAREPVAQIDGVVELLERNAADPANGPSAVVFWLGNDDASLAALGSGGANPSFLPLPFQQIAGYLDPSLSLLLAAAEASGAVSFAPYTEAAIERNLTTVDDFTAQLDALLTRIAAAPVGAGREVFVLTLPYYSAVGYLMDSADLEFYLGKWAPGYRVPESFARVAPDAPLSGDRVSLLTFGIMVALLEAGASVDDVDAVLTNEDLVMSQAESAQIRTRIDAYNAAIAAAVAARGAGFHWVDVGGTINDLFVGDAQLVVDGRTLTRNWSRGNAFSLYGVHPGYTAQALAANLVLSAFDAVLGGSSPQIDLATVLSADPYVDEDGDGWVPGPEADADGVAGLLLLFTDPDDDDADVQPQLPPDLWQVISRALYAELLGVPQLRDAARAQLQRTAPAGERTAPPSERVPPRNPPLR